MDPAQFIEAYSALSPGEQDQFEAALIMLLGSGILWREDERSRAHYSFVYRHQDLVRAYLAAVGWQLLHHERNTIFQVVHREGAHRKKFTTDMTLWLLLLRLLYAEQQESMAPRLTRYPVVSMGELVRRYGELPGTPRRRKVSLEEALSHFQRYHLVRVADGRGVQISDENQLLELLPPLEVIVPAERVESVASRLRAFTERPKDSYESAEIEEELDIDIL